LIQAEKVKPVAACSVASPACRPPSPLSRAAPPIRPPGTGVEVPPSTWWPAPALSCGRPLASPRWYTAHCEASVEAGGRHRLRGFVAVVQPDVLRRVAPGQARHLYPHEGEFVGAVEALDVVRQHGLLVLGHEAQVGRGLVGREEIEIAGGQAHQHRHARGLGGDAGGLGVQGDLLADGPGLVPPRLGGEGQHQQADSEGEETFHGKGIKRPAHARAGASTER
jgi:hypothetical protein